MLVTIALGCAVDPGAVDVAGKHDAVSVAGKHDAVGVTGKYGAVSVAGKHGAVGRAVDLGAVSRAVDLGAVYLADCAIGRPEYFCSDNELADSIAVVVRGHVGVSG